MALRKKFQVFVSSTYTDMHEERQAAVEAILTAGHIPAGMELFTAGDLSQMQVIKQWIDESDVYLLILGGRYGSLERQSQKSYIHLEYEYALEKQKPLFAVVIDENYLDEKVQKFGRHVIETEYAPKLREFREFICTRMVRFWSDPRDIKLAILETLAEFSRRDDIIGWIPGNEAVNTGALAEEIARLTKENAQLREQVEKFSKDSLAKESILYNGLTFDEMCNSLKREPLIDGFDIEIMDMLKDCTCKFGDDTPSLLHLLWILKDIIFERANENKLSKYIYYINKLEAYGIIKLVEIGQMPTFTPAIPGFQMPGSKIYSYSFTDEGRRFILRLLNEYTT